jgi:uncharacterized protein YjlB
MVLFGGEENEGKIKARVEKGDVIIVPAGIAHRLLEEGSEGFEMVGSYPTGYEWDMCYGKDEEKEKIQGIKGLEWFQKDPVYGDKGPVLDV